VFVDAFAAMVGVGVVGALGTVYRTCRACWETAVTLGLALSAGSRDRSASVVEIVLFKGTEGGVAIYLQAIHAVLTPAHCGQYTLWYLHGKINVDHTSSLRRIIRLSRIDTGGFPSAPSLRSWLSSILRLCAVRGAIAEVLRLHLAMTTIIDTSVGPAACVHGDHSRISFAGRGFEQVQSTPGPRRCWSCRGG